MRRFRHTTYLTLLLLAPGFALSGAATAQTSATSAAGGYVALGDSYSSGVGAGSRISSSGKCKRSAKAYPYLWSTAHAASPFAFNACSGARTDDVLASQLSSLNSSTSLVSITIGGNDVGFADVMMACATRSNSTCLAKVNTAKAYVDSTLLGKLDTLYNAISAKAPSARVIVLGYPRFYKLGQTCIGLSETKRSAINDAADHLNDAIQKRALDHNFVFGDVSTTFSGHEVCSNNSWLHSINWLDIGVSYHPKAAGQSGGYLPILTDAA